MSFVKLDNLNDFIQPSTSCVKPLPKKTVGVVAKVSDINLNDCLACSGCITSAETVLVKQQNYDELFKVMNDSKLGIAPKTVVVSLSLQSISSIAAKYSIDAQEAAERLASFFISIGCDKVYDINIARHLALVESYKEFKKRKETNTLPVINSTCPGWICYAEKTNGDLIIPYLSKVRSPQQIMGALVKQRYQDQKQNSAYAQSIYHLTVMPCYDKKLEASRENFTNSEDGTRDVDCVLTPIEIEDIIEKEEVSLLDFNRRKLDLIIESGLEFDQPLTSHHGSSSGGYAENLLLAELEDTFGTEKSAETNQKVHYTTVRNSDFIEVSFKDQNESSKGGLNSKFVIVNGFRNIQTVVQRLKRKALKYDYVEIMACPSGCINGGAQCKTVTQEERKGRVDKSLKYYKQIKPVDVRLGDNDSIKPIIGRLNLNDDYKIKDLLYTNFRSVPKMQNLIVSW